MASIQDFTKGSIKKQLLIFSLPILLGNIFQQFYNIADTAIAGYLLGSDALSAIGATAPINSLILMIAFGLNGGFGIIIARSFGEKDFEKLKRAFAQSLIFVFAFSLIIGVLSPIVLNAVLKAMNTPDVIFKEARSYILILLMFVIVTMLYNLEATVLRSLGDSKTPLYFVIVSSFINIGLDWMFISTFKMGVRGAAAATVIAQGISCILCAIVIMKKFKIVKLTKESFRKDFTLARSMLSAGLAMSMMNSIFSIGSIILQAAVNSLGTQIIAAQLAARKISEVYMQPLVTVGTSCSTIVSQNYGAGKAKRIGQTIKYGTLYSTVWAVFAFITTYLFGKFFIVGITGTEDSFIIDNALMYIKINTPFYCMLGLLFNLRFSIQSINAKIPPLISSAMELASKIIAAFFLIPVYGYLGACVAEPISWVLGAVFLVFAFKRAYNKAIKSCENINNDNNIIK